MQAWEHARTFVELALSIEPYFPGYVDAYYGPEEIREALERRGQLPLAELARTADGLLAALAQERALPEQRKEYLAGEVRAMRTALRLLQGERLGFLEEVRELYGLAPSWTDEAVFEQAQAALDALIPGDEPLAERLQTFRDRFRIPLERAAPLIERLSAGLRARARRRFGLPDEERCTFAFVHDQPWGAYNWYLGNYASRIDFNLDFPIRAYVLPNFIAHEAYPGHHSEHSLKEQKLYREAGLLEHSILLSNAPSAVISEGIAVHALEMIFSPEELADLYGQILEQAGLSGYPGRMLYEYFHVANRPLRSVRNNQLLLLHEQGASDEQVIAYGRRYGLTGEQEERKYLQFAKDPLWRSYGFNYTLGYNLLAKWLSSAGDRDLTFARLLQEPLTPAQVERLASQ